MLADVSFEKIIKGSLLVLKIGYPSRIERFCSISEVTTIPVQEFELGDIAECPHCGKKFEMNDLGEEDYNDFDKYFEHVSICV